MTNWEERINRGGDPAIVIEHVVRYRFAAPLLSGVDLWIDAACGTGYAPSLLLGELVTMARAHGFHTLMARIVGGHDASIRLHAAAGFEIVGTEREVGRKFGRWLDVVVMQQLL